MPEVKTVKDYINAYGVMDFRDLKTGWGFWSDGISKIGGKFKVAKNRHHLRIL